ncbi:glycosyltransferase family 2 protein [Aquirufa aurantiipilula]|uniref:glycosyltransferase family 2 protein n=1 Tax=Aquirufa aurantiipilula TaxID=2696561 RepID=UPI001CAA4E2B|nr:glycosyltransferase family 2 protein [Aquirufa aurantiipilula]MBZ1325453.1 glycosyltransferase family 2 protein [Aquirufa aurantiipilula]
MKKTISILLLTYNEEIHLERCIQNVQKLSNQLFIIDSFSTDKTLEIAAKYHIPVIQNKFIHHANQINYALEVYPFETDFIIRVDCDELLSDELIEEINECLNNDSLDSINGFYMQRKVKFMGGIIHYGMTNPMWLLRIWKRGEGKCDDKWMDEKIVLNQPNTHNLKHLIFDHNLNNLTWWTQKHNLYASRESIEVLKHRYLNAAEITDKLPFKDTLIHFLKSFYNKSPIFVRSILLFHYSYFLRLGILDGIRGLMWNILQVFWYRFLVDAKVYEFENSHGFDKNKIKEALKEIV